MCQSGIVTIILLVDKLCNASVMAALDNCMCPTIAGMRAVRNSIADR